MCTPLSNEQRKQLIEQKRAILSDMQKQQQIVQAELNSLVAGCLHEEVKKTKFGSAQCSICQKYMGWFCKKSPTKTCDYEQEDGEYDEDHCRYCGMPDERK